MATNDSPLQITTDSERSDSDTEWDDSVEDPDYDALQETTTNFSNLSLKRKAKPRIVGDKGLGEEVNASENFEKVQKLIQVGLLEKLKVDECKLYLRKNGLRLSGNKDTLIQRIKEHLEILNGGEKKYPPSSFVLNCKGDACTDDVVLFEQNVYEMLYMHSIAMLTTYYYICHRIHCPMDDWLPKERLITFSIASRSASGPPCGKRIVAGRIVKESYGAAKQQHTFTIEVLWSKGEKPLPPLYPLLIKGRNLYRLKTMRQKWEDEAKRQKILMEKHSRGSLARADREARRIQEKEKRKKMKENRVSSKASARNQSQSHSHITRSQHQPQETNVPNNPEKPELPSQNSGVSAHLRKEASSVVNKPAAVFEQRDKFVGNTYHMHWQQAQNRTADYRSTSGIDRIRGAELSANYNYAGTHHRMPFTNSNHPFIAETTGFTGLNHHNRVPLANANHSHPFMPNGESYKQKQLCRHYSRGRCYFGDNCKFLHDLRDRGNA